MLQASSEYVEAIATILSGEHKVTIKPGKSWSVQPAKKTLTYVPEHLVMMPLDYVRGILLHEIGHLKHTELTTSAARDKYRAMALVHNIGEDFRVDYLMRREYGSYAEVAVGYAHHIINSSVDKIKYEQGNPLSTLKQVVRQASCFVDDYADTESRHYKAMTPDGRVWWDKTHDAWTRYYRESSGRCDTSQESVNAADGELFKILEPLLKQIKDEGLDSAEGEGEGEGEEQRKDETPCIFDDIESDEIPTAMGLRQNLGEPMTTQIPSDMELSYAFSSYIGALAERLRNIFQEKRAITFKGAHKSGRLLSKNTYKVTLDEKRIFSRRNQPEVPDVHVVMCLDESGSMGGERHTNAYIAAYLIDQVCKRLKWETRFVVFNANVREYKSLADYRVFHSGDNNDAGALKKAIQLCEPDKQNLILMFSDGGICTDVRPAVKTIKEMKNTELIAIGVGITGGELKKHYGNAINVPLVSELPMQMIALFKRLFHRG